MLLLVLSVPYSLWLLRVLLLFTSESERFLSVTCSYYFMLVHAFSFCYLFCLSLMTLLSPPLFSVTVFPVASFCTLSLLLLFFLFVLLCSFIFLSGCFPSIFNFFLSLVLSFTFLSVFFFELSFFRDIFFVLLFLLLRLLSVTFSFGGCLFFLLPFLSLAFPFYCLSFCFILFVLISATVRFCEFFFPLLFL